MPLDFANELQFGVKRLRRVGCFLVAIVAIVGCRPSAPAPASHSSAESGPNAGVSKRLVVFTTILPVYCFAVNVAGDFASVDNLLPPGVGPHDYQLTPADVTRIRGADLVIANGLDLERTVFLMIDRMADAGSVQILEIADGFGEDQLIPMGSDSGHLHGSHTHGSGADPHIWLDPLMAIRAVDLILDRFKKLDPDNAAGYEANARRYSNRLMALHDEIHDGLLDIDHRSFITFHNAFAYFARRYDLVIAGVVEPVPDVSPPPRHLVDLRNLIREQGIPVIFTEPQFRPKLALRLAEGLAISVGELDTLEAGPIVGSGYEDGMRRNLFELRKYLRTDSGFPPKEPAP